MNAKRSTPKPSVLSPKALNPRSKAWVVLNEPNLSYHNAGVLELPGFPYSVVTEFMLLNCNPEAACVFSFAIWFKP